MTVEGNISDLFFNRDFAHCSEHDLKGQFTGFNEQALREEADTFLANIRAIGPSVAIPTTDELLADFHGRV